MDGEKQLSMFDDDIYKPSKPQVTADIFDYSLRLLHELQLAGNKGLNMSQIHKKLGLSKRDTKIKDTIEVLENQMKIRKIKTLNPSEKRYCLTSLVFQDIYKNKK